MQISLRVLGAVVLLAVGCGSPRMLAPGDVVGVSEQLVISDRSSFSGALADESFQMGGFAITEVDRNWNSRSEVGVMGFTEEKTKGGYSFNISGEGATLPGKCTTGVKERSHDMGGGLEVGDEKQSVGCFCKIENVLAYFSVHASTTDKYQGALGINGTQYRISGVYERESGPDSGDPTGYRVDSSAGPIGAVDVVRPGRVWISRELPAEQRGPLACLFAGLLLYEPPSHNFD